MSAGLDVRQLLELVIRPTLAAIGLGGHGSEMLVLGTAATESMGFRYVKQLGRGPALGLWQMEPATYLSLWRDLLDQRPGLKHAVLGVGSYLNPPAPARLISDLALGAAMCRVRYLWDPHPIPRGDDVRALAETWKRGYNTAAGKGTVEKFLRDWQQYVAPALEEGATA